ncbi:phage minor tail protein L [Iodobacter fluviatilis]|uniref:Phage minor tail protein L n=1 Tax=Iodobacter fluviatilis TaxID=537 RepID=A0A7G3GB41_9NEIS|nr:phage minor tail protein L [Iodobacter fluviatilis]QBC44466.1 phage minor tail protein L [Iodobacter fluviatilis]
MLKTDIQTLTPGAHIELFELDMTQIGGDVVRFHAGTNALTQPVVWKGQQYAPYPVEATGFAASNKGAMPRPSLKVANVVGLMSALAGDHNDLLGCKVTRRRTLAQYLDTVNFPDGVNPSADPSQEFPPEIWMIDRKALETPELIEFELASPMDLMGQQLPARQIVQNCCTWRYRGSECGYTGGPVADINDLATTDSVKDQCGKRLASCKLRFGANSELPYGGYPAAGLLRY